MYNIVAYIVYLSCSLITVLWVGKILHRNGKDYLFAECPDKELSESTNNMLYMLYCLLNSGYAFYFLKTCDTLSNISDVIVFIASTEGFILMSLGVVHFLNMLFVPKIITFILTKKSSINLKN